MSSPVASSSRNFEGESTTLRSVTLRVADDSENRTSPIDDPGSTRDAWSVEWKNSLGSCYIPPGSGVPVRGEAGSGASHTRRGKPATDVRATEMGRVRK